MTAYELRLFGPPQLYRDGEPVSGERRKALALLAYLVITDAPQARSSLAALFWPESDNGLAYLRRALYEINHLYGDEWLEIDREMVAARRAPALKVDLRAFRELAAAGDAAGAVDLVRGPFMAGFSLPDCPAFDAWQRFEGDALQQQVIQLLRTLIDQTVTAGEDTEAATYIQQWLALDAYDEAAHRQLLRIYQRQHQRTAALRHYDSLVGLLEEELGVAPEPETEALISAIRRGETAVPSPPPPHRPRPQRYHFPTPTTPFIGRRSQLQELADRLQSEQPRLINLVGPGGMGKTRLAIALARRVESTFPDGICFVPLAPLGSDDQILTALANALHFTFYSGQESSATPREQLADFLRPKKMLLVLDNCEHLRDGLAGAGGNNRPLLTFFLESAPGLQILTTSRVRFNLQGETIIPLSGLRIPTDESQPAESYSAAALFLAAARRIRPDFQLDDHNWPAIRDICRLTAGMPLAIELAAGWLELLTPADIAAEISQNLDFLESGWQDLPERQRSMRAVFDASWKILSPAEREVWQQLTLFSGSFDREAARAVAGASLRDLQQLVNKSLLMRGDDGRFSLHELLRQFAAEKLSEEETRHQAANDRHSDYFARRAAAAFTAMCGPDQKEVFVTLSLDIENIRKAWFWATTQHQFHRLRRMVDALVYYTEFRVLYEEMLSMIRAALSALAAADPDHTDPQLHAYLHILSAILHDNFLQQFKRSRELVARGWELYQEADDPLPANWEILVLLYLGYYFDRRLAVEKLAELVQNLPADDPWLQAYGLYYFGQMQSLLDEREAARETWLRAREAAEAAGDRLLLARTLAAIGQVLGITHRYAEAFEYAHDALQIHQEMENDGGIAFSLTELAFLHEAAGAQLDALLYYRRAKTWFTNLGNRQMLANHLSWESMQLLRLGQLDEAREIRLEALDLFRSTGNQHGIAWSYWELGEIARVRGDLDAALQLYRDGLRLFEKEDIDRGIIFYFRGLGDVALMRGDFADAYAAFEKSVRMGELDRHNWSVAYALNGQGRAALGMGDRESARQSCMAALQEGSRLGRRGLFITALAGIADWLVAEDPAAAAAMARFLQDHPATWYETRAQLEICLQQAEEKLASPGAQQAAAEAVTLEQLLDRWLPPS